mmetsp:Transcript_16369/g.40343  ORF Transcript_16369/g.40343 Transcript_16369/m.40343 type:complete len:120 (-) Transcript_16369:40-399(-)
MKTWVFGSLFVVLLCATGASACEIDVCFAIDDSSAVGRKGYEIELNLVNDFVDGIASTFEKTTRGNSLAPRFSGFIADQDSDKQETVSKLTRNVDVFKSKVKRMSDRYNGGFAVSIANS